MYVHQNEAMNINKVYPTAPTTTPATSAKPNSRAPISSMDIDNSAITWTTPLVFIGIAKTRVKSTIVQHNNLKTS